MIVYCSNLRYFVNIFKIKIDIQLTDTVLSSSFRTGHNNRLYRLLPWN